MPGEHSELKAEAQDRLATLLEQMNVRQAWHRLGGRGPLTEVGC